MTEPSRWRAVVFDLWDTLIDFPWPLAEVHFTILARRLAVDADLLRSTWQKLEPKWETMPITPSLQLLCRELDLRNPDIEGLLTLRVDYMRRALRPQAEVIETLHELRTRGFRLGLITACSGDVPMVWNETLLGELFDSTVFSSVVGFTKPDPRIYQIAVAELGVPASTCLYVGDGGRDELGGAARAGMTPILLRRADAPASQKAERGLQRIRALPEVIALVDRAQGEQR